MDVAILGWREWRARHARQALTIMKIELRRAFFSRRAFWVYALALLPAVIFLVHTLAVSMRVAPEDLDFDLDRRIFAGVFQFYYLRLAVFFGALGIFMNLFRGEMLDKTLHFWFLAPVRREVLLLGKYGAGLAASTAIFVVGALLAFVFMVWPHDAVQVQAYWREAGVAHAFWYALATALGCVGYGSVFLAAGLFLRNPVVPAAVLLAWEGVGSFLPAILQKASILYYLQSLCPVSAPMDSDVPVLLRLLLTPATPASHAVAVLGLLAITALTLWLAAAAVRKMQISYGSES